MKVAEVMTKNVQSLQANDTLEYAASLRLRLPARVPTR